MKKKLTFGRVLVFWGVFYMIALFVIGATVKSTLLSQIAGATLGIFLIIVPVYPDSLELFYGRDKARKIIRIIAAVQIVSYFFIRFGF